MTIDYELIYSKRKTLAIQIKEGGKVVVRAPMRTSRKQVEAFLTEKQEWIRKYLEKAGAQDLIPLAERLNEEERREAISRSARVLAEKTAFYAKKMGVTYGRITIREQKTRWGSCSSAGNLNFNWKLILMPEKVLDYVVIHELAHRKEMNHSPAFYQVVCQVMPDYQIYQKWLRDHGREY